MSRKFIAILPLLNDLEGHIFHYHVKLSNAVNSLNWVYYAHIPCKTALHSLPNHWIEQLPHDHWKMKKTFIQKMRLLVSYIRYLKGLFKSSRSTDIVFLEHFQSFHLAALYTVLYFSKNPNIWILNRYSLKKFSLRWFLFRLLTWKTKRLRLFADSDLLATNQAQVLQKPVHVVPIPHGKHLNYKPFKKELETVYFWSPGGSFREEKGFLKVLDLIKAAKEHSYYKFLLSQSLLKHDVSVPKCHLIVLPSILSEEDYTRWLSTVDVLLLPYDAKAYEMSTSGIFVEGIIAGCIPIVSKNSWMDYEYKKHGITEFSFSDKGWHLENITKALEADRSKLKIMQKSYQAFHTVEGFAREIKRF